MAGDEKFHPLVMGLAAARDATVAIQVKVKAALVAAAVAAVIITTQPCWRRRAGAFRHLPGLIVDFAQVQ